QRLGGYSEVDVFLDTFPYNCGRAGVCEALWMGVPVIALWGDRTCGRTSASVLAQIGLEGLIAETGEKYAATAVELAGDLDRLRTLRAGMRERMKLSPLMDEAAFARRFGSALRDMWRRWCRAAP
ncbi:MAG: glycosyltransferase, partial [Stellaceae bacterium]